MLLYSCHTNAGVALPGYRVFRADRKRKSSGGTCVYVHNRLHGRILSDLTDISNSGFQQQWIQIQRKKLKSFVLCVVYRPPNCPVACLDDDLAPSINHALTTNKNIVITGDLNLLGSSYDGQRLVQLCNNFNLKQLITKPTRATAVSRTLIDVIIVSNPHLVRNSQVMDLTISYHFLVYTALNMRKPRLKHRNF